MHQIGDKVRGVIITGESFTKRTGSKMKRFIPVKFETCGHEYPIDFRRISGSAARSKTLCKECVAWPRPQVGEIYRGVTIMSDRYSDKDSGIQKIDVKCRCGKAFSPNISYLFRPGADNDRVCGDCFKNDRRNIPFEERCVREIIRRYRRGAKTRGIDFTLTDGEFKDIIRGDCHYCGVPAEESNSLDFKNRPTGIPIFRYNGIDRVDSTGPYVLNNCVPCCKTCNVAKSDMSYQEFMAWISRLVTHRKKERTG